MKSHTKRSPHDFLEAVVGLDYIFADLLEPENWERIQDELLEYLVPDFDKFVCMHSRMDFVGLDSNFG